MGMSASQMRLISLTARQSDLQYHGQQINERRLEKANESAQITAQLQDLKVPTPPSSSDFTETTYSFLDASRSKATIKSSLYNASSDDYTVYYSTTATGREGESKSTANFIQNQVNGQYQLFNSAIGQVTTTLSPVDLTAPNMEETLQDLTDIVQDCQIPDINGHFYGDPNGYIMPQFYTYESGGGAPKYVLLDDLMANAGTGPDNVGSAIKVYDVNEKAPVETNSQFNNATITWSETGRMTSLTDAQGNVYPLTVNTTTDEVAYNDAMNEYGYQQAIYSQKTEQLNAKIKVVQEDDKSLDIQLKRLDTENQAITTEVDAVKAVIKKNVEFGFKTFSG